MDNAKDVPTTPEHNKALTVIHALGNNVELERKSILKEIVNHAQLTNYQIPINAMNQIAMIDQKSTLMAQQRDAQHTQEWY